MTHVGQLHSLHAQGIPQGVIASMFLQCYKQGSGAPEDSEHPLDAPDVPHAACAWPRSALHPAQRPPGSWTQTHSSIQAFSFGNGRFWPEA